MDIESLITYLGWGAVLGMFGIGGVVRLGKRLRARTSDARVYRSRVEYREAA